MERNIRTDLAIELRENAQEQCSLQGIKMTNILDENDINRCVIDIENNYGVQALGKPVGRYITLESKALDKVDLSIHKPMAKVLYKVLKEFVGNKNKIMVVGLGNRAVTPDSLGPCVVDNLYITRHLVGEGLADNIKELSAISPGVMAQTGIESQVLLKSLCKEIQPEIVIAVDALAAIAPERLNRTIQICNTGINPGSGVGNNRARLDKASLGVEVIAVGVPTVISVHSLVSRCIEDFAEYNDLALKDYDNYECIEKGDLYKMYVTPQNVDEAVKRISFTISEAINMLL